MHLLYVVHPCNVLYAPSAQSSVGVALQWGVWQSRSAQFVAYLQCRPHLLYVVYSANLRYRPLTFLVVWTSPPLPLQVTVATRLHRASLSVSEPSATRRALGRN